MYLLGMVVTKVRTKQLRGMLGAWCRVPVRLLLAIEISIQPVWLCRRAVLVITSTLLARGRLRRLV